MKQTIDTLIPVDLYNDVKVTGTNKFKATPVLKANDGTIITQGLSESWLIYMKHAINNYRNIAKQQQKESIDIVAITLPGTPMTRQDGNIVNQNDDGTFSLCPNREFTERYMYLKSQLKTITQLKEKHFPIKIPVIIECEFHVHKSNRHYNLAQYVSSTVELMVKLKLLKNDSSDVVARVDGSKICYTNDIEKTVVTIKKLTGG